MHSIIIVEELGPKIPVVLQKLGIYGEDVIGIILRQDHFVYCSHKKLSILSCFNKSMRKSGKILAAKMFSEYHKEERSHGALGNDAEMAYRKKYRCRCPWTPDLSSYRF